jgi:uncharacterized protein DUF6922
MSRVKGIRKYFRKPKKVSEKPNLRKGLFWDVRYEEMDWQWSSLYVITRVLDRGSDEELAELILHTETVEAGTLALIRRLSGDAILKDFVLVGGTALALQLGIRKCRVYPDR